MSRLLFRLRCAWAALTSRRLFIVAWDGASSRSPHLAAHLNATTDDLVAATDVAHDALFDAEARAAIEDVLDLAR